MKGVLRYGRLILCPSINHNDDNNNDNDNGIYTLKHVEQLMVKFKE